MNKFDFGEWITVLACWVFPTVYVDNGQGGKWHFYTTEEELYWRKS